MKNFLWGSVRPEDPYASNRNQFLLKKYVYTVTRLTSDITMMLYNRLRYRLREREWGEGGKREKQRDDGEVKYNFSLEKNSLLQISL